MIAGQAKRQVQPHQPASAAAQVITDRVGDAALVFALRANIAENSASDLEAIRTVPRRP
ncbi:hypothetical protein [Virgisporangium aurantiacum]|uniref:Uncharacterized protein n=1 Tax=Virgisporangium aurantiacum TaxID=175570 RepID=A0A8J3Z8L1_9ACTN|nr:hypothetical protein [Virgisporangium aurantiacum]GIJ57285.1 hypothetical protein Vau01_048010 [Virgisporangium aurantiacum]